MSNNKKVELVNYFGSDLMCVNAARISFNKTKEILDEKDERLIKFLVEHKHFAPFFHPQLQFRIQCPIYVERQIFKTQIGAAVADILTTILFSAKSNDINSVDYLRNLLLHQDHWKQNPKE